MKKLLFFITGLILLTACRQDDKPFMPTFFNDQVNFSDLKAGQQSLYRAYQADCADMEGTFEWTEDTLVLEVMSGESGLFLQESFTKYSPSYNEAQPTVQYPISSINDGVLLPERSASQLFYFYANDTIRLNPTHDVTLEQDVCLLKNNDDVFIGNDIGYVPSFKIGEVEQEEKTAVSCEPFFELDGYLIYDNEQLHVSHVTFFNVNT